MFELVFDPKTDKEQRLQVNASLIEPDPSPIVV